MATTSVDDYDMLFKIMCTGDTGVGKSALILRFSDEMFNASYISTIGVDFKVRSIEHDGKTIKLQIWDTAGQERFRTITAAYYRGSHGIIVTFDVTDEESFNNVKYWLNEVHVYAMKDIPIILVGNKIDMETKRKISTATAEKFARDNGLVYVEASAKTGAGVDLIFSKISELLIAESSKHLAKKSNDSVQFNSEAKPVVSTWCPCYS